MSGDLNFVQSQKESKQGHEMGPKVDLLSQLRNFNSFTKTTSLISSPEVEVKRDWNRQTEMETENGESTKDFPLALPMPSAPVSPTQADIIPTGTPFHQLPTLPIFSRQMIRPQTPIVYMTPPRNANINPQWVQHLNQPYYGHPGHQNMRTMSPRLFNDQRHWQPGVPSTEPFRGSPMSLQDDNQSPIAYGQAGAPSYEAFSPSRGSTMSLQSHDQSPMRPNAEPFSPASGSSMPPQCQTPGPNIEPACTPTRPDRPASRRPVLGRYFVDMTPEQWEQERRRPDPLKVMNARRRLFPEEQTPEETSQTAPPPTSLMAPELRERIMMEAEREDEKWKRQRRNSDSRTRVCRFCLNNNETPKLCHSHSLRDPVTNVLVCPVLRGHECEGCGATGDDAHTKNYCPKLKAMREQHQALPMQLKRTRKKSDGKDR